MANRMFERVTVYDTTSSARHVPHVELTCSMCGSRERMTMNTKGRPMAPEGIAQKFRNNGWHVSPRAGGDVCPACIKERARGKHFSQVNPTPQDNVVTLNTVAKVEPMQPTPKVTAEPTIKAEPPREMTREDRRLIFAKLQDVYVDEKTGYDNGWSDNRVSTDLGVPLAWVRTIRDENFGTERSNEEWEKVLKQSTTLLTKAKDLVRAHAVEINDILKAQSEERKSFLEAIIRFETKLTEITKALGR